MERWLYDTLMYSGWGLYMLNAMFLILYGSALHLKGIGFLITYLVLSPLSDFISMLVCSHFGSNLWVLNSYILVAGIMLYFFFGRQFAERGRRLIYMVMAIFVIAMIVESLLFNGIKLFNKISYALLSLSVFSLALQELFFKNQKGDSFKTDVLLWVSSALMIYYGSTLLLIILQDIIMANYAALYYDTWYIQVLANVLLNAILIIGFWRIRRISLSH